MKTDTVKFLHKFNIKEVKEFGSLTVFHIIPKEDAIDAQEQVIKNIISSSDVGNSQRPRRYRWNEIFEAKDFYIEEGVDD